MFKPQMTGKERVLASPVMGTADRQLFHGIFARSRASVAGRSPNLSPGTPRTNLRAVSKTVQAYGWK